MSRLNTSGNILTSWGIRRVNRVNPSEGIFRVKKAARFFKTSVCGVWDGASQGQAIRRSFSRMTLRRHPEGHVARKRAAARRYHLDCASGGARGHGGGDFGAGDPSAASRNVVIKGHGARASQ